MNAKSILPLLFAVFAAIGLATSSLVAATFGLFTYTANGTSITITDYPSNAMGVVNIPATIAGKPVSVIGSSAFSGCSGLSGIKIKSGVTSIGSNAFSSCSSLAQITIPSGIASIGEEAFSGCPGLGLLTIPCSISKARGKRRSTS